MLGALAAQGCTPLGWRFGPGFSSDNTALFARPPVVVRRGDVFALAWTYGTSGFFFRPNHRVMNGRLVFVLQGSSSSGSLRGRPAEMVIVGEQEREAIEHGGACWWEPSYACTPLRIVGEAELPGEGRERANP